MKKLAVILGVLLALGIAGFFGLRAYVAGMKTKPVLYTLEGMENAERQRDIVYRKDGPVELRLDVYRPAGASEPAPAVLLIHGGGPEFFIRDAKDWRLFETWAQLLTARGLVGVTFNHRGSSDYAGLDVEAADVQAAVDYVRAHAAELGVDPDRLALWAFSAGGVYLAGAVRDRPDYLKALVGYYAVMDLDAVDSLLAKTVDDAMRARHSPSKQLGQGERTVPPTLLVKAIKDRAMINQSIDAFVQAAALAGQAVQVWSHDEGHHGFDVMDNDAQTRDLIRRSLDWVV
ncbi:MAG: alpha/beta hydrolase, partial [Pseudomonadota bacterium]